MADTDATPAPPTEESYSKDYVETLKKQLEEKTRAEAMLKAKFSVHEDRQRAQLAEMQPTVVDFIKEGLELGADFKHEMAPMMAFGESLAEGGECRLGAAPRAHDQRALGQVQARARGVLEDQGRGGGARQGEQGARRDQGRPRLKAARISELENLAPSARRRRRS